MRSTGEGNWRKEPDREATGSSEHQLSMGTWGTCIQGYALS